MTTHVQHEPSMKGEFAGFASRFVAFVIDLAIVLMTSGIISWAIITVLGLFDLNVLGPADDANTNFGRIIILVSKIVLFAMPFVLLISYWMIFWTVTGQTIGKRIMGVRVVRMDGQRMKIRNSVRRVIMYFVSMIPFFLGFLVILIDDERRGWHDKFANTCVIYAWDAREVEGFMVTSQRRVKEVEERMATHTHSEPAVLEAEGQPFAADSAETAPLQSSEV